MKRGTDVGSRLRLIVLYAGRGTARAEDAQETPTQSHISPSILVYEDSKEEEDIYSAAVGAPSELPAATQSLQGYLAH